MEGPRITSEDVENETRAIRKLCRRDTHPNIIEVLRLGELPGSPYYYIDMELCDLTLTDYIYKDSPDVIPRFIRNVSSSLKEMQIWNVMKQIVSGVEFIHRHNEVHRDLKSSNSNFPDDLLIDVISSSLLPEGFYLENHRFRFHLPRIIATSFVQFQLTRNLWLSRSGTATGRTRIFQQQS